MREHGQPEMPADLAAALELRGKTEGLRLPVRLVRRVDAAAVRVAEPLVERDGDVLRAHSLDQVAEEARKTKHGMHGITVPVDHVRQHGVVSTEDVYRGVDQEYQLQLVRYCRLTTAS